MWHFCGGEKGEAGFYYVSVFTLGNAVELGCVRWGRVVGDATG